jgi:drug/metabolite transporter (DMT)-like permease
MLSSALSFSLMGVCVKAVGQRLPVVEVVLGRAVISLALSLWLLRRARLSPWGERRGLLVLRGVLGTAALYCVYGAIQALPLGAATVIQYLHPTFTALLAWLLLGERLSARILVAIGLGWLGVWLLTHPLGLGASPSAALHGRAAPFGTAHFGAPLVGVPPFGAPQAGGLPLHPLPLAGLPPDHLHPAAQQAGQAVAHLAQGGLPQAGVLLAVAGALLTALAYVSVRALGRSEDPLVVIFYFPLVGLALTLPLVLLNPVLPSAAELAWLVGVGLFTQLGQLGLTKGLMGLPAAKATALSYVQVPLASLWGLWLFHDQPSPDGLIAALLVLAATVISLRSRPAGAGDR